MDRRQLPRQKFPPPPRGGLARDTRAPRRLNEPKQHRTLNVRAEARPAFLKQKVLKPSDVRLKVRNLDEKQVTNDDLKKLFQKIGELKVCKFDRNEFGQFLGSATVTFQRPEDAKLAVQEYNGAYLDDKVLTVEFDMVPTVTSVVKSDLQATLSTKRGAPFVTNKGSFRSGPGKTL
jgi:RNA recognition motif-containing protein